MTSWSFLANHARALLRIAHDPGVRLRDIAAKVGITERSPYGTGLAAAGYLVKQKDGRRNRCHTQAHLPLPEPASQEPAIGDVLAFLAGAGRPAPDEAHLTVPGSADTQRTRAGPLGISWAVRANANESVPA